MTIPPNPFPPRTLFNVSFSHSNIFVLAHPLPNKSLSWETWSRRLSVEKVYVFPSIYSVFTFLTLMKNFSTQRRISISLNGKCWATEILWDLGFTGPLQSLHLWVSWITHKFYSLFQLYLNTSTKLKIH